MDDKLLYSDILGDIKTVGELEDFVSEIDIILGSLYKRNDKTKDGIFDKKVAKSTAVIIKKLIEKNGINASDYPAAEKLLSGLKEYLKKSKTLKMSLAIEPSEEIVDHIFNWVLENMGDGIILDIERDESILGGAIISFNGTYKDLSLRRTLEEIFNSKKAEIMNFAK